MTKPPARELALAVIATMLAAGGAWLTSQTVNATAHIETITATTELQFEHVQQRLDAIDAKLDRLLAPSG